LLWNSLINEIKTNVRKHNNDDYVFYYKNEDEIKRYLSIKNKISRCIKKTKLIPKSPNYTITPNMFRTTLRRKRLDKCIKKATDKTREVLGHRKETKAVYSYLDSIVLK
jgi:hypothetical protein